MSFSDIKKTRDRFCFIKHNDPDGEPLSQVPLGIAQQQQINTPADLTRYIVLCDSSTKIPANLTLNTAQDPFHTPSEDSVDSTRQKAPQRPILYHSAGLWKRAKKFRSKVEIRDLYYQHFLNIKRVSDHQVQTLQSTLSRAKRSSNVEDSIAISLFLHESSGLRTAIDTDVDLFRKWKDGGFKGSLKKKLSSERMLFKGYVDLLHDHWRHLSTEELFELPILRMLSRTPRDVLEEHTDRVKSINQRSYFQTLMHVADRTDKGHTLY